MKILKYPLYAGSFPQTYKVPYLSTFLSVSADGNGQLCAYFMVDDDSVVEYAEKEVLFSVVGTGWDLHHNVLRLTPKFIGTVKTGVIVWHVFGEKDDRT